MLERINDSMEKRQVRRLKNLQIVECSLVNAGAGENCKVVLAKRQEESMPISMENIGANADRVWNDYVDIIAKADNLPRYKATIKAAGTEQGKAILMICKTAGLHREIQFQKLGGDGIKPWGGGNSANQSGVSPSAPVSGDDNLARLRSEHTQKVARKYIDGIAAKLALGMSQSDAIMRTLRDVPEAKSLSAADMMAAQSSAERDANQLRRPGRGTSMSNGAGQNSLGMGSASYRAT
jgi:hypothetical protein